MSVDKKTVDRIATLAKLEFSAEEKDGIVEDMNKMLDFVDQLNEVDTKGVEPLIYMVQEKGGLREDIVKQEISQEEALKNAPDKDTDFIKVPKVLKK